MTAKVLVAELNPPTYYPFTMDSIDQQEEWRLLRENYGQMTEDELCAVAADAYQLTELAKEALRAEISERGFHIQLANTSPTHAPIEMPDEDLVNITRLWDAAEAKRVKAVLDAASIPSYLGPDHVLELDDFKSSFDAGVDLKVSAADRNRAMATLAHAAPDSEFPEDDQNYAVLCPKCHSPEIVFQGLDPEITTSPDADAKFNWSCDACGYQWKDEGIEQSV